MAWSVLLVGPRMSRYSVVIGNCQGEDENRSPHQSHASHWYSRKVDPSRTTPSHMVRARRIAVCSAGSCSETAVLAGAFLIPQRIGDPVRNNAKKAYSRCKKDGSVSAASNAPEHQTPRARASGGERHAHQDRGLDTNRQYLGEDTVVLTAPSSVDSCTMNAIGRSGSPHAGNAGSAFSTPCPCGGLAWLQGR